MNFLAHLYLSGNDEEIIVGNFIADMVKGSQINGYGAKVAEGIRLHRKIDGYTDAHPVVHASKGRLRGKYRLYAGVVVDMFYDHFLARNWSDYSSLDLHGYVGHAYAVLSRRKDALPPRAQFILPYMMESNWLVNYADLDSLRRNFGGMARRTPFDSGMEGAVDDLVRHYDAFEREFRSFFPDLADHVEKLGFSHTHHRQQAGPTG